MAVSKITKINLIALKKHEQKILDFLHHSGFVQIIEKTSFEDLKNEDQVVVDFERKSLDVDYTLGILEQYKEEEKVGLVERISSGGKLSNLLRRIILILIKSIFVPIIFCATLRSLLS